MVQALNQVPALPAAIEIASYRIVQEALTNVVRYAQAHTYLVRLQMTAVLELSISDYGVGLPKESEERLEDR